MADELVAMVAGGGIAGLASAVALAQAGYQDPTGRWLLRIPADSAGLGAITTICGIPAAPPRRTHLQSRRPDDALDTARRGLRSCYADLVNGH
jgi:glycine/D-amino acid oxidase-like deaminating enzyme